MSSPEMRSGRAGLGGVLLAAGSGRRLGQPKQLLKTGGQPLVERAARHLRQLCDADVVVVTGAYAEPVTRCLQALDVTLVHNPDWRLGLGSSLARGLDACAADAALIMVCDQSLLETTDLLRLIDAWSGDTQQPAAASYANVLGVPAIIPRKWFGSLGALDGDSGAREFLRNHQDIVIRVPMPNAATDIDQPRDLETD